MQKTINIGGEDRPVNFGTSFLYNFQERYNQNPLATLNDSLSKLPKNLKDDQAAGEAFLKVFDFKFMIDVLTVGLETGAELQGTTAHFPKAVVCEWIDEQGMDVLGEALGLMFQALPMAKKNGEAKATANGAKKKTPAKR